MGEQGLDSGGLYLIASASILWAAAIILVAASLDGAMGLLLAIGAGTETIIFVARQWYRQGTQLFILGYHAGYHTSQQSACAYPDECSVLDFAELQAKRAGRMG